ncbi:MAG: response regulator [Cyclobacteriaceae bacterium]|nr:response regulator [Cyclobacteriaceae bacterium]
MISDKYHVLIIDDNEDILFMLKTMLKMKGYEVSVLGRIDNILEDLRQTSPDLILMDMLLAGADGREVCKLVKANPDFMATPIIMISAHPSARKKCLESGADFFIEKPFEMEDLLNAIKTHSTRAKS